MADFAAGWDSFYVIVGAAAGALIGLQFVVMTLIAQNPPKRSAGAVAAFSTPTIVHFSASLLLCALMRVPWPSLVYAIASFGLVGGCGLAYTGLTGWRMGTQTVYRPVLEDWALHLAAPAAAYALLAAAVPLAIWRLAAAQFAIAAATLVLLFIGIHNAWDAVSYHVLENLGGYGTAQRDDR